MNLDARATSKVSANVLNGRPVSVTVVHRAGEAGHRLRLPVSSLELAPGEELEVNPKNGELWGTLRSENTVKVQTARNLRILAAVDNGQLEDTEAQYATLLKARSKPHVIDDAIVDRATRLYSKMREDAWLFDEQLDLWRNGQLTDAQHREVERLTGCMQRLLKVLNDVLGLAGELKKGTIDRILEMPDEEAGIVFLTGKLKLPGDR